MKLSSILFILLSTTLFFHCKNSELTTELCKGDDLVELTIVAVGEISLIFPECFTLTPLQGIDSYVGKIEASAEGVEINYDIGLFAGEYVSENSANQTMVQGDHELFRYTTEDDRLVITFPGAGPANFYTSQIEYKDDLIEFFRSLKVN